MKIPLESLVLQNVDQKIERLLRLVEDPKTFSKGIFYFGSDENKQGLSQWEYFDRMKKKGLVLLEEARGLVQTPYQQEHSEHTYIIRNKGSSSHIEKSINNVIAPSSPARHSKASPLVRIMRSSLTVDWQVKLVSLVTTDKVCNPFGYYFLRQLRLLQIFGIKDMTSYLAVLRPLKDKQTPMAAYIISCRGKQVGASVKGDHTNDITLFSGETMYWEGSDVKFKGHYAALLKHVDSACLMLLDGWELECNGATLIGDGPRVQLTIKNGKLML